MNFTTKIPISKSKNQISYSSRIVSLGSCFAENMAEKFEYFKFQNTVNPFGIIFNPVSIEKLISRVINQEEFTESAIFFHKERWHCYEVHSDLSTENKEEFLENLNSILKFTRNQILNFTHIIITYGTSWVYRLKSNNEVVANCHKVAQNQFDKEILSIESIEKSIQNTIHLIQKVNPDCQFIFTVSPVRHIKDGFVGNQRSKAHLIAAIHNIVNYPLQAINYFPSYEILMDELRDYRFYSEDMLHPNQIAIDYIWEQFFLSQISEDIYPIMTKVCAIQKGLAHKAFNSKSVSHQQFVAKIQAEIMVLQKQLPQIKF